MTGDLISREALMQFPIRLNHYDKVHGSEKYVFGVEDVLEYAQNLPVIDAVPVVHGRWREIKTYDEDGYYFYEYKCSACGCIEPFESGNYCSYCGARMDKEADDALD